MKKKFHPKVSIVIPVYNGSNYVREAIDSALAQTYHNFEVVVVNDGSTDEGKTDQICKSYGNKIRYLKKENGGAASALNKGIEEMEGEYFSWLSHDDVYYPEKIEKQIEFLSRQEDRDSIIPYASYELIDEDSKTLKKVWQDHNLLLDKPEYALLRGRINGITLLIPRKAFEQHGKFDEELKCTQDYDMWLRISKSYKFVHMNQVLTKTRIHPLQDSNKHPNVVKEGDPLWINMMEQISDDDKKRLEGTIYNYYREMNKFLDLNSPYEGAKEYAQKKMREKYIERLKEIGDDLENYKIAVIVPFYNEIDKVKKAIESIKNQTHKNYEIILINDGSTEDIKEIKRIVNNDKKTVLIESKENKGPGFARNIGIKKATGHYIAFLDADDVFLQGKLKEQLKIMLITGSKISHTSYIQKQKGEEETVRSGELSGDVVPEIIKSCPIATPTVMIEKRFIKENDYRFREDIRIGEDTCFWLETLRNERLEGIEQPFTVVNKSSTSASSNLEKHLVGLSNILSFVFSDEEYKKYHNKIAYLCQRYVEVSQQLTALERQSNTNKEIKKQNKFVRMFQLFRYQGFVLTIKKALRKYVPKGVRKFKSFFK